MLAHWAGEISSGRLDRFGEQEILPHFLADFFVGLLGYIGPAGHNRYTIGFERYVEVDGKYADAVLGDFNGRQRYVVAVEGKGPRDPLDRPYAGRRMSAAAEALQLERQLSDLVNEAYGLTADEVALLWKTSPPRMPFAQA